MNAEDEKIAIERFRAETDRQRAATDQQRLALESERVNFDRYRGTHEVNRPYAEAVMRFADLTVRSLLLLNGGAALAVLTFATNANKSMLLGSRIEDLASLVWLFALGAGLSVATSAASYLAQVLFTELDAPHDYRLGNVFRGIAVAFGFAAMVCFFLGMWNASAALSRPLAAPSLTYANAFNAIAAY